MSSDHAPLPATAQLAATYRRAKAKHGAAPAVATVRRRLASTRSAFTRAAEAFGDLTPTELTLLGIDHLAAAQLLATLDATATSASVALATLDQRGARAGGNRRITALLREPSPRHQLIAALAEAMPSASKAQLLTATAEVLVAAGHGPDIDGAEHVVKQVLKARRTVSVK